MRWIAIFFIFIYSFTIKAQEKLSLEQCMEMAKRNNKYLLAANNSVYAAQYDLNVARTLFFPKFSFKTATLYSTLNTSYRSNGANLPVITADGNRVGTFAYFPGISLDYEIGFFNSGGVVFEQPIYVGGKITALYRMRRIALEMAQEQKRLDEWNVVIETLYAYASLSKAIEMQKVAMRYSELLEELMRNVESAYRNGLKQKNELLKVKVRLNESYLGRKRADNARRLACMNLCHYIGRNLTDTLSVFSELPYKEIVIYSNIENRPEYKLLEQKSAISLEEIKLARSKRLPNIAFIGFCGYLNGMRFNNERFVDDWNFTGGISFSIPLYHFGEYKNEIKAAKARYARTLAEQCYNNEKLILEMTQTANKLDEARTELDLAETALRSAEENLRVSDKLYKAGMETIVNFLEAQVLWQQAAQTAVESRINLFLRMIEYQRASGGF